MNKLNFIYKEVNFLYSFLDFLTEKYFHVNRK